mmetsp:Transcript_5340/g.6979  ORF Transcript_5340/g.6979 Transcript_5340/m.6979 type:complete len:153 (+) Transcript_5340:166-624(+)
MPDKDEIIAKMQEYSVFVNKVLQPQLAQARATRQKTQKELDEYNDLMKQLRNIKKNNNLTNLQLPEIVKVDLGHEKVFCEAKPDRSDIVFIHVGLGFHVEFTIVEGIAFVGKRVDFLDGILKQKSSKVQQVEEHVASSAFILEELSRELRRF